MSKRRHIVVSEENYSSLKRLGQAGDSFNDVVTEILRKVEGPRTGPRIGVESQP
jgi:predicted CopG family antitoxin